jgi:Zn-dependent protease with chaperone function
MSSIYPPSPQAVPEHFTNPSASYKRHAWLAVGALLLFLCLYLALAGWFSWKAWWLIRYGTSTGSDPLGTFAIGLCCAFLAFFMIKGLFFVSRGGEPEDIEVKLADEPQLFAFLNQLADETGAPRPHRVFLSPRVNAAVFYDLSLLNLIFPSKKNLEIGLPLINLLTLGEFKAVLAHEFGHFAQRSMAVGRWVYISQQIASYLIRKRDGVDKFLQAMGSIHLALTAVAWVMNLIVWSIRALIESVFHVVLLAQRALSREMELQADRVSVSVTGSDALINALYRTSTAEETWDRALDFANQQLAQDKAVEDLFAVQSRLLVILRKVRMEPDYGQLPAQAGDSAAQRLFKAEMAQPSRMWSTHPLNHEREIHAKSIYIPAALDDRSSWLVFANPIATKRELSEHLIRHLEKKPPIVPIVLSLTALELEYDRVYHHTRYRGIYLGRFLARAASEPSQLYDTPLPEQPEPAALYPTSLQTLLQDWRELEKDKALLNAIQQGQAKAHGGVLRYHGEEIEHKQLPKLLADLERRIQANQSQLQVHDRQCRSHALRSAQLLSQGWESHLRSLGAVLHYSEHSLANLADLYGVLNNTLAVTTAAGPARKKGATRIIEAAQELHAAMLAISQQRHTLQLQDPLASSLPKKNWNDSLGNFDLITPALENINEWIRVIDGWYKSMANALDHLRQHALEQLLLTENQVLQLWAKPSEAPPAPAVHQTPKNYAILLPGQERKRQTQLSLWARFQRADGPVAAVARLSVALGVVGSVVGLGGSLGSASLTIYNGLARPVLVKVGTQERQVPATSFVDLTIEPNATLDIQAHSLNGHLIERFSAKAQPSRHQIYNVASASPIIEWTASYGSAAAVPDRLRGTERWFGSDADVIFSEPPKSISSKSGSGTRLVLAAVNANNPMAALDMLSKSNTSTVAQLVSTHARWDEASSGQTLAWLHLASSQPGFEAVLASRLKENPTEMLALRLEQDRPGANREQVCTRHQTMAAKNPNNADLKYLIIRCLQDNNAKDAAFDAGYREYPQHPWFAYASGYTLAGNKAWDQALSAWKVAMNEPSLRDSLSLDSARLRRLQAPEGSADLRDLLPQSQQLRSLIQLETGQELDAQHPLLAYTELAKGRLAEALSKASNSPDLRDTMMRLVATADGAQAQWLNAATALPIVSSSGKASPVVIHEMAVRLKAKQGIDWANYGFAFDSYGAENKLRLQRFVSLLQQSNTDVQALESSLQGSQPDLRGIAYWLGHVALGSNAPPHWAVQAKRLLFVGERSYIK